MHRQSLKSSNNLFTETMTPSGVVVPDMSDDKYHEMYVAAARGDMKHLEDRKSEIDSFVTPAKNTILHVYIIAQSRGKEEGRHFMAALLNVLLKSSCIESLSDKAVRLSSVAEKNVGDMLDLCPPLLWKTNGAGDTPLHMAARHGQAAIAKVLIDRAKGEGKDVESETMRVREMLHMVNKGKETALHQAVRYQHIEVVRLLVDEDDPDFKHSPNEEGETPLYMAAERGNFAMVKLIVERYNSPAYQGPQGATALHAAALHSVTACTAIVEKEELKFLTKKVDNKGRTPLHYGGISIVHDRSAAFVRDKEGKTAVHVLAGKGNDWMVRKFVKHCPECFELDDDRGRNALHYAVESGDKDTVEVILKSEYLGDLLKKKDKEGLTPLHLLALNRFHMPNLINDPRLDKMAFNAKDLTPNDIILTSSTHSRTEVHLEDSMKKVGINPGRRLTLHSESKINPEYQTDTNKVITKPSEVVNIDQDELKDERQNHLVVAALIATVTFAAGFTLPGGYNQDGPEIGYAVLTKQTAFQGFVIFNTLAMVLSSVAVFIHLLIAMNKKKLESMAEVMTKHKPRTTREKVIAKLKGKMEISDLFSKALPITLIAIVAMVLAFIAGTYAVLSHARVLAVAACVMGSLFFGLFWYLWKELFTLSKNLLQLTGWVLFGLFFVLCGLVVIVVVVFVVLPLALVVFLLRKCVCNPICFLVTCLFTGLKNL